MTKKLLIDASVKEETRLVVLQGQKIEAFETETQNEIKGNIYLASVTRVEPSLQAAFIEYGGNRHGFLAFPEIHPDYFQIPTADRDETPDEDFSNATTGVETSVEAGNGAAGNGAAHRLEDLMPEQQGDSDFYNLNKQDNPPAPPTKNDTSNNVETITSEDTPQEDFPQEDAPRQNNIYKKYNIQEVIKRGQVLLVQIVKEERGNKGAALTTFLSLAGRYCVLMPNSESAGGISRKVPSDIRNKIRSIIDDLKAPQGMSLIVRTAGANQPKGDLERDFEYLMRLWESIRELTLESKAPALIYEEGNLVQRSLRDFVKKDVGEIQVEGAAAYQKAKQYMEQLMPAELCLLKEYKEAKPIFDFHGVEALLDQMLQPTVQLKSGGYIVINPTEALVAIDVNSGKATSEHNIEDTAFKTNLEAADEIARQAKLRDLGGLIVVDFIDMESSGNIRAVERRMRDAVRADRAKVQTGRISSSFGLLEMSRQRLSPEISERRTEPCPECDGSGQTLTAQTIALRALREGIAFANKAGKNRETILRLNWPVVLYLLNERKDELLRIEKEQGIRLRIEAGGTNNPNKPWTLETRKLARTSNSENKDSENAVNMETAYTQMTPPDPEAYTAPQDRAQNQPQNKRQRHKNQRHGRGREQGQGREQGREREQGQGQGRQKRYKHQNKSAAKNRNKPPASAENKPSFLKRLLGKK